MNKLLPNANTLQNGALNSFAGKTADRVVECLRSAVVDGAAGLADVPSLVKRVIGENLWRVRETKLDDQAKEFESFADFVAAAPPAGLGTNMKTLLRLCDEAPDALDLLIGQMPVKGRGGDRRSQRFQAINRKQNCTHKSETGRIEQSVAANYKRDNVTFENDPLNKRPTLTSGNRGNSKLYSLMRLRAAKPELYDAVVRGEVSTHQAMISAGLRRPNLTISATDPAAVAAALAKKFDDAALGEIAELLTVFLRSRQSNNKVLLKKRADLLDKLPSQTKSESVKRA